MDEPVSSARQRNRAVWEAGDWDKLSDAVAAAGHRLLDSLTLGEGTRLLDIGTGSGGAVAIPAAWRGAEVVGADITDAWFDAARRRAAEAGVEVQWVVGDAVELPFEDASFDIVTSTFGHMFAPDQAAAASELARVCKPGGTIGLCCWTPQGNFGRMMVSLLTLLPIPEGFRPPMLWGSEPHVRELLEPHGVTLEMHRTELRLQAESVEQLVSAFEANFGPIVMARAALGEEGWAPARENLSALFAEVNLNDDRTMAMDVEYLETIGRKAS
jgi:ubiquinone/menaquinone biosynthesis C-methylase UbiE